MTMKLGDQSIWNILYPLTKLKNIEKIVLVRDTPGHGIDKVCYINPVKYGINAPIVRVPIKLIQLIYYSLIEKPSLIHSYLLFPHGYLALITGKLTRRKVGVSLIAGPIETQRLFGSLKLGEFPYCRPLRKSSITNMFVLSLLDNFDIITVTGSYTKDYLVTNGIDIKKIFIMPHIISEQFKQYSIEKDYDVIFLGRLSPEKNIETIILATGEIKKVIPSIRFVIVGTGNERENLEGLAQSLDLTDQIHFAGYQSKIWEWYNRSKISVIASEREGFPYTAIESLKCGLPVVSSNCGDICDIVKDSYNGFIIPDYLDYKAFAKVIIKLLKHPDILELYSKNALKSVEDVTSHSVEKVWENILKTLSRSEEANTNEI